MKASTNMRYNTATGEAQKQDAPPAARYEHSGAQKNRKLQRKTTSINHKNKEINTIKIAPKKTVKL
jgi:hypothetical protein